MKSVQSKKNANHVEKEAPANAVRRMQIRYVRTNSIDPAKFNPSCRTETRAIQKTKMSVAEHGILSPLQVLQIPRANLQEEERYILIDGHRRWTIANILGIKMVPCVVHPEGDPAELWAELNGSTRTLSAYEWLLAWHKTGTKMESRIPTGHMKKIRQCVEIFGSRDGIQYMISNRVSPSLAEPVLRTYEAFVGLGAEYHVEKALIAKWIIQHELQLSMKTLQRGDWSDEMKKRIHKRVVRNQTIALADLMNKS